MLLLAQAPEPDPAPAVLTPTAAIITAAAVVLVGLVTTGVQIWIARRNWEEQRKQAADDRVDQRRRDAEQREDQRGRDLLAFEREDRYRFASEKRTVYTEYLRQIDALMKSLHLTVQAVKEELARRGRAGETDTFDYNVWLFNSQNGLVSKVFASDNTIADQVWMLAPRELGDLATSLHRKLFQVQVDVFAGNDIRRGDELIDAAVEEFHLVRDRMQTDLQSNDAGNV